MLKYWLFLILIIIIGGTPRPAHASDGCQIQQVQKHSGGVVQVPRGFAAVVHDPIRGVLPETRQKKFIALPGQKVYVYPVLPQVVCGGKSASAKAPGIQIYFADGQRATVEVMARFQLTPKQARKYYQRIGTDLNTMLTLALRSSVRQVMATLTHEQLFFIHPTYKRWVPPKQQHTQLKQIEEQLFESFKSKLKSVPVTPLNTYIQNIRFNPGLEQALESRLWQSYRLNLIPATLKDGLEAEVNLTIALLPNDLDAAPSDKIKQTITPRVTQAVHKVLAHLNYADIYFSQSNLKQTLPPEHAQNQKEHLLQNLKHELNTQLKALKGYTFKYVWLNDIHLVHRAELLQPPLIPQSPPLRIEH